MAKQTKLAVNLAQDFTADEKAQGRANLGLADVAASGSYNDLSDKPSIPAAPVQSNWTESDTSSLAYIRNKPNLATVATSGSYTDLTNKPVIPPGQLQSDWAQADSTDVTFIKNKPDLSVYATQTDLSGKQDVLTAGPNIDITNNVISTEQVMVTAGTGITVAQSYNPTSNVVSYEVSSAATAPEVFYAEYNVATVSDISAAKTAGKLVYTLIPGTYYPTVAYLRETTRNGAAANFASPVSDNGAVKVASVDDNGTWSSVTLNLATMGDISPHKVAFVDTGDSYTIVENYRSQGYEIILTVDSDTVRQYFRLVQKNPDGSMEFSCLRPGSGFISGYTYHLQTNDVWTRTDTAVRNYTGIQIDGIGRNLHLNQYNYVQTNIPGGIWNAPTAQSNNFVVLSGADFAGAYRLAVRHNPNDTYELALIYTASGMSSTITFIGTETVVSTGNAVTVNQACYIGERSYYTPSVRFGYNVSTVFDPTQHKAIYYSGLANIGPCSDTKIAIWNDDGTVKVGFTSVEVGKVGSTL